MTKFSATASPGQRWKIFLSGAAAIKSNGLSMSAAAALIRKQWLSRGTRRPQPVAIAVSRTLRIAH